MLNIIFRFLIFLLFLLAIVLISNVEKLNFRKKILIVLFVVGASFAQAIIKEKYTYPLVYWGMYISPAPSPSYMEYSITLKNGLEKEYPFRLLTFSSPRATENNLYKLIDHCYCDKDDSLIDNYINAMNEIYKNNVDKDGFLEMKINRITVDLKTKEFERELKYKWMENKSDK
jgi:hypothetical protein